jgi:hypothetical protein
MAKDFVPKNFIRHVAGPMLGEYFGRLQCLPDVDVKNPENVDSIFGAWQA